MNPIDAPMTWRDCLAMLACWSSIPAIGAIVLFGEMRPAYVLLTVIALLLMTEPKR